MCKNFQNDLNTLVVKKSVNLIYNKLLVLKVNPLLKS